MSWLTDLKVFFAYRPTIERASPKIRITPEQADAIIRFVKTIPGLEDCFVAGLQPSNSEDPIFDEGMYVVLQPRPHTDLIVGDIIWFEHPDFTAIHRIIEIGNDGDWYCKTKGDNNSVSDPVKVRAGHIKGTWRMTLD